ncbi:hypothetical protein SANTM175S_07132 [Streptomyces antimycoticus]
MRGAPRVLVVAPRIGARLDGGEAVGTVVVGQRPPHTGEVGVERRGVLIAQMGVAARRVGLPQLDELAPDGAAPTVQEPSEEER